MLSAALDIGTNTLRLLIRDDVSKKKVLKKNYYLLLGKHCKDGHLDDEGLLILRSALIEIKDIFTSLGVDKVYGVATAFARNLKNSKVISETFKDVLSCEIKIIDGETEGKIVSLALKEIFNLVEPFVIIDIGGGSTEFINEDRERKDVISIDMGSLFLKESFLQHNPPKAHEIKALIKYVENKIMTLGTRTFFKERVYGVGGTFTTLAFLLSKEAVYNPEVIMGFQIKYNDVKEIFQNIRCLKEEEILAKFPLEKGREKVLLAGVLEVMVLMKRFEIGSITVSDVSLIDGIFSFFERNSFSS